jgi:hypothetical protein
MTVVHSRGCNRFSALVQSRQDDTAEVLRELVGCLRFSPIRGRRYSLLAPCTPNRPQARWDFHCILLPGPGHVSPTSRSSILSLLRTSDPLLVPLITLQLSWTLTSAGTTMLTTHAPDMRSARYPLKPWALQPRHHEVPVRSHPRRILPARHQGAVCFANVYRRPSVPQFLDPSLDAALVPCCLALAPLLPPSGAPRPKPL